MSDKEQTMNQARRRFMAHLKENGAASRAWVKDAESFLDAAVRFAETTACDDGEVAVVVTECDSGRNRCFLVNLGTGDISGC